jgi:hypothetical protein
VQLDLDAVWSMLAGRVPEDMPARDQEQPMVTLEEEAGGVGQALLTREGEDRERGEQDRFDHRQSRERGFSRAGTWTAPEAVRRESSCSSGRRGVGS